LRDPRDDAYGAADRVPAEQRSLRSPQHLDTFDVEEIQDASEGPAEIDAVEIDPHARLGVDREVHLTDAAQADHRCEARA
jgi:hypothetical protein